jgi:nucleoside-diphosphate-sugar epimerase
MDILLTGSTGFLGTIIYKELSTVNNIISLARKKADINVDLSTTIPLFERKIDLVIHSAGKAHSVPINPEQAKEFFDVNVQGTSNLLDALSACNPLPKSFTLISSVAVYGIDKGENISEESPLLAQDAYGASKIRAEQLVTAWCLKNNVICTILRLPLIAGPNAPGNLGAMIKGINGGYYFNIAEGNAQKSIVLATDVANIIINASAVGGVFNLTDREHPSFKQLAQIISTQLGKSSPKNIPFYLAKVIAFFGDFLGSKAPINSSKLNKIVNNLTFNDSKAVSVLGWKPNRVLSNLKIK